MTITSSGPHDPPRGSFATGFASSELSWFAGPGVETVESDAERISRIARTLPADAPNRLTDFALAPSVRPRQAALLVL